MTSSTASPSWSSPSRGLVELRCAVAGRLGIQDRLNTRDPPAQLHGARQAAQRCRAGRPGPLVSSRVLRPALGAALRFAAELKAKHPSRRSRSPVAGLEPDAARHAHAVPAPVRQRRLPPPPTRDERPTSRPPDGRIPPRGQVGDRETLPVATARCLWARIGLMCDFRARRTPAEVGSAPRSIDARCGTRVRAGAAEARAEGSLTGA
jgi:hypothetical protein